METAFYYAKVIILSICYEIEARSKPYLQAPLQRTPQGNPKLSGHKPFLLLILLQTQATGAPRTASRKGPRRRRLFLPKPTKWMKP